MVQFGSCFSHFLIIHSVIALFNLVTVWNDLSCFDVTAWGSIWIGNSWCYSLYRVGDPTSSAWSLTGTFWVVVDVKPTEFCQAPHLSSALLSNISVISNMMTAYNAWSMCLDLEVEGGRLHEKIWDICLEELPSWRDVDEIRDDLL